MPLKIVRNDITKMCVDAIVNTANPRPVIGGGTDTAIHTAAGPELLEERLRIGDIPRGESRITKAYGLPAKYVIHSVSVPWNGGMNGERLILRGCYESALRLAEEYECASIAVPLMATGSYGCPAEVSLEIAMDVFHSFLEISPEMEIYLVVFGKNAYELSQQIDPDLKSYVDNMYVEQRHREEFSYQPSLNCARESYSLGVANDRRRRSRKEYEAVADAAIAVPKQVAPAHKEQSDAERYRTLEDALRQTDECFTDMILRKLAEKKLSKAICYHRAGMSKAAFYKMLGEGTAYHPKKKTAVALALALELSIEETRELLYKAGYVLTNTSKFDIIVTYHILHKQYNTVKINIALDGYGQPLIGYD